MALPIITAAVEDAPTAVDFTSRYSVEAALLAAMAAGVIWPSIAVCSAVFSPHSPDSSASGAVCLI